MRLAAGVRGASRLMLKAMPLDTDSNEGECSMLKAGLTSVTFRCLSPPEIVDLVVKAGIGAIEWGGDVHVPPGDLAAAAQVKAMMTDHGLVTSSYGSYYRVCSAGNPPFQAVLDTAVELGVPTIRVWAGRKASADADEAYRQKFKAETLRIAESAEAAGLDIAFEYHLDTLTDTEASARRVLRECDRENIKTYWQPLAGDSLSESGKRLEAVLPRLSNLHVFHCIVTDSGKERRSLAEGRDAWQKYFSLVEAHGGERYALIEFVSGESRQQFLDDAETLKDLIAYVEGRRPEFA